MFSFSNGGGKWNLVNKALWKDVVNNIHKVESKHIDCMSNKIGNDVWRIVKVLSNLLALNINISNVFGFKVGSGNEIKF